MLPANHAMPMLFPYYPVRQLINYYSILFISTFLTLASCLEYCQCLTKNAAADEILPFFFFPKRWPQISAGEQASMSPDTSKLKPTTVPSHPIVAFWRRGSELRLPAENSRGFSRLRPFPQQSLQLTAVDGLRSTWGAQSIVGNCRY